LLKFRNAYKWCAVIGWPAGSWHNGTPASDLIHIQNKKVNKKELKKYTRANMQYVLVTSKAQNMPQQQKGRGVTIF